MPTNDANKAPKGPSKARLQAAGRAAAKARGRLVEDVERLCADAGISLATLAREAGIPNPHLWRMMAGKANPTLETYAKLAIPLGADLSARLYPNTGPLVRDRHQARIVEALLPILHPRWGPTTEVGVTRPARGWIDLVLHAPRERIVIATEVESDIRRIEQQIRWAQMKRDSLPSWEGWPADGELLGGSSRDGPRTSQLLIVRRTRATRQTAKEFARQLALAYPAHPDDALAALTGTNPWPGSALIWAEITAARVRFLPTR